MNGRTNYWMNHRSSSMLINRTFIGRKYFINGSWICNAIMWHQTFIKRWFENQMETIPIWEMDDTELAHTHFYRSDRMEVVMSCESTMRIVTFRLSRHINFVWIYLCTITTQNAFWRIVINFEQNFGDECVWRNRNKMMRIINLK